MDTTAPTLNLPPDLTAEATGPAGAAVTYTASASDLVDGAIAPVCSPSSGSTFTLGTTPVNCSATDAAGNTATGSFNVTVADTTPPNLILPPDLTAEATGPAGAAVTYIASANDPVDGAIVPACSPTSGRIFSFGTTPVSCTVTDAAGNTATGSFNVTVVDTIAPETTIVSATDGNGLAVPDGGFTSSTSISVAFEGLDAVGVAGFECSIDGAPFAFCAGPLELSALSAGTHSFAVRGIDPSGNADPSPATFSWQVVVVVPPPGIDATVTTDEDGSVIVSGVDDTGQTVVEVTLPPESEIPDSALDLQVTSRGVNNAAELTGVAVPYPPGKAITIRSNPGASFVCIVDRPEGVLATGLPNCGSTDTSISQVRIPCDATARTFTGFPDAPAERTYTCSTFAEGGTTFMRIDGLAFSFVLDFDACPSAPGSVDRQGCPAAIETRVQLHVVDQAKSGACPDGQGSCRTPAEAAEVRVYDRDALNGLTVTTRAGETITLGRNPDGSLLDDIFESPEANARALAASLGCVTVASGVCRAGVEGPGDHLVIVRFVDPALGRTVYTGRPKGTKDYADSDADGLGDLVGHDIQILKVIRRDGTIQFTGGSKVVVRGSYLEVVYPDFATWEEAARGFVYPFVFTSDSDWDVDLCAQVPEGYEITGAYDEEGALVSTSPCVQRFVSGETKVVAFEVVEVGSPEPILRAGLRVRRGGPQGRTTVLDLQVPGRRSYARKAADPPGPPDRFLIRELVPR